MFGEKACNLIKELDRNRETIAPYNTDLVKDVSNEIKQLIEQNQEDVQLTDEHRSSSRSSCMSTIKVRHAAIKRNLRCILAYHYNRVRSLRTMRWEFGGVLPADIKANLCHSEIEWFSKYCSTLAQYMRSVGDGGINLSIDLKPPKLLYIEVHCLVDYGLFELNDGSIILLKKNSRHYLPRNECEELIRQGVFEHII